MAAVMAAFLLEVIMATVKVKPWGKDQGDYVLMEEEDFDPKKHKLYEESKTDKAPKQEKAE